MGVSFYWKTRLFEKFREKRSLPVFSLQMFRHDTGVRHHVIMKTAYADEVSQGQGCYFKFCHEKTFKVVSIFYWMSFHVYSHIL